MLAGVNDKVDGRYGRQIAEIVKHLEAARAVAPAPMARALAALVTFYRSGAVADREQYDIAWVQDKTSPVDTINGFIEVYLDPRGVKGGWEGIVFYVNQEKTARIRKLKAMPISDSTISTAKLPPISIALSSCSSSTPSPD